MGRFGNAKRFPRRLGVPFERMAWNPSSCAPHPGELLEQQPRTAVPADRLLESLSANDVVSKDGFVIALSLSGRAFISGAEELFRRNPIHSVRLVAIAPYLDELALSPRLANLTRLDLSGNQIGSVGLKTLLASPFLANLEELGLSSNGLEAEGVEVLNAFPGRERIRRLELVNNTITNWRAGSIIDRSEPTTNSIWPSLTTLDLSDNPLGPDVIASLMAAPIAELCLENVGLTTLGTIRLAKSPLRPSVLNLGFNRLNDAGVGTLANSQVFANCTKLNLRGNFIREVGAEALLRSTALDQVRYLDLRANPLEPEMIEKLRARFGSVAILS